MNGGALDDTLKTGCRFAVLAIIDNQTGQLIVDIIGQIALQGGNIHPACLHHRQRFRVMGQSQK